MSFIWISVRTKNSAKTVWKKLTSSLMMKVNQSPCCLLLYNLLIFSFLDTVFEIMKTIKLFSLREKANLFSITWSGEIKECADQTANVTRGLQNSRIFHHCDVIFSFHKTFQWKHIPPTGSSLETWSLCQFSIWSEFKLFHKSKMKLDFW